MIKRSFQINAEEKVIEINEDIELFASYKGLENFQIKSKLIIVHKIPNIKSRINIRAIVFDNAKFDLEVVLKIEKGAYATDTYLKIDCLVVGDNAYARAIPSLEIKESEVKGGHGATIGYIDENQLNYLYSKGLNKKASEDLIIDAFLHNQY